MRKKAWLFPFLLFSLVLCACSLPKGVVLKGVNDEPALQADAPKESQRPDGCEGAALDFLEALQAGKRSELLLFSEEIPGYTDDYTHPLYRAAYESLQWKLQGFKEGKSGYTLTVELTVRDMRKVLEKLYDQLALTQTPGCDRYVLCARLLEDILAESDYPTLNRRETITLSKATGTWRILYANDFFNAAAGYLPQALNEFDLPPALGSDTPLNEGDASLSQSFIKDNRRSFTVLATYPNDPAGYRIAVECGNGAGEALVYSVGSMVVNGYVFNCDWYLSVPAGQTLYDSIILSRSQMESCGIDCARNISFQLEVFAGSAWPVYPELSKNCTLYPHGRDDGLAPLVQSPRQQRLIDSWCAGFTVLDVIDEGCWGVTLLIALDNRCGEELWFGVGELHVDGREYDPGFSALLPPGCKAVEELRISAGEILRSGREAADSLEFRVFISDLENLDNKDERISAGGRFTVPLP